MGAPFGQPGHHRQHRRGPIQRLDLGFLVHTEHQRLFRRIQVQPDDVADLVDELWVIADLEGVDQVRLEPECLPDPTHGRFRQPRLLGHRRPRPVGGVGGLALQRGHHHRFDLLVADRAGSTRARLVGQPVEPFFTNRCRHLHTVCGHTPTSAATSLLDLPAAQPNTIRHRCASACEDFARRAHRCNVSRSSSVNTTAVTGLPRFATHQVYN